MDPTDSSSARPRPRLLLALSAGAVLLMGVLLLLASRTGLIGGPPAFHGTAFQPPEAAADFALTDHTGQTTRLSDHRGKVVLLFFGFANCPDVCPLTLGRLSRVLQGMDADTSQVRVLLVTVDPERDTPEALAGYVTNFSPHVVGLTGDSATLADVRADFYAFATLHRDHEGHVQVSHTPQVFGIDRAGQLRVLISPDQGDEVVRQDVRTLLRL